MKNSRESSLLPRSPSRPSSPPPPAFGVSFSLSNALSTLYSLHPSVHPIYPEITAGISLCSFTFIFLIACARACSCTKFDVQNHLMNQYTVCRTDEDTRSGLHGWGGKFLFGAGFAHPLPSGGSGGGGTGDARGRRGGGGGAAVEPDTDAEGDGELGPGARGGNTVYVWVGGVAATVALDVAAAVAFQVRKNGEG